MSGMDLPTLEALVHLKKALAIIEDNRLYDGDCTERAIKFLED